MIEQITSKQVGDGLDVSAVQQVMQPEEIVALQRYAAQLQMDKQIIAYAVRIAIFMGMTNPAVAATQFTAYMALANVAISVGNYWQGVVAERVNYQTVLYVDAALVVLALCVIPFLKNREEKKPTTVVPNWPAVR